MQKKIKRELKCAQTKKERKSLYPAGDFLIFTFKYDTIFEKLRYVSKICLRIQLTFAIEN